MTAAMAAMVAPLPRGAQATAVWAVPGRADRSGGQAKDVAHRRELEVAEELLQQRLGAPDVLAELGRRLRVDEPMRAAVACDLVPGVDDAPHDVRMALGFQARMKNVPRTPASAQS